MDFIGYIVLGETIDKDFLDSLNISQYYLEITFPNLIKVNNFSENYLLTKKNYISHNFFLISKSSNIKESQFIKTILMISSLMRIDLKLLV